MDTGKRKQRDRVVRLYGIPKDHLVQPPGKGKNIIPTTSEGRPFHGSAGKFSLIFKQISKANLGNFKPVDFNSQNIDAYKDAYKGIQHSNMAAATACLSVSS